MKTRREKPYVVVEAPDPARKILVLAASLRDRSLPCSRELPHLDAHESASRGRARRRADGLFEPSAHVSLPSVRPHGGHRKKCLPATSPGAGLCWAFTDQKGEFRQRGLAGTSSFRGGAQGRISAASDPKLASR